MQIKSLKIFCDIVRLGSFSKAAELNGVSQPNVSQLVHHLEDRLGVQLIDRSKRPFVLTVEGEKYHQGCRDVVQRYDELESEVRLLHDAVAERLNVASIYSAGLGQLHRIFGEYRSEAPGVALRVDYMHPDQVHQAVLDGEADLGIVSFAEGTKRLAARLWREEPFALAVAPHHPLAGVRRTTVGELAGRSMVMPQTGLRVRDEIDRWLASHRTEVRVELEFDNLESVKRAVEVEEGIGLLPAPTFASEARSGALVRVDLVRPDGAPERFVRPLGVIHRRGESLSPAASLLIDLLDRHADEPPEPGPSGAATQKAPERAATA